MLRDRNEFQVEGELPPFDGATTWLNGAPLTPAELRGRVVLVSSGTYTCVNWRRSLPYVRAWATNTQARGWWSSACRRKEFEDDLVNVGRALEERNIRYIDGTGHGTADYQRMYQLIRQPPPIGDRLFEIEFLDAGVEAYVFTFG